MNNVLILRLTLLSAILFTICVTCVHAKVSGSCSNCHTMHNSQNNSAITTAGANPALLKHDCVGCHSSDSSSTYYELDGCKIPVVLYTGGEPTEYLAGGNFYWVKEELGGDDTKGHNAFLNEADDNLEEAPGGKIGCGTSACHSNLSNPYTDTTFGLKGKFGCQGCHIKVRHHAQDHQNGQNGLVNSEEGGWYRFLSGHQFTSVGVEGYENGTWEAGMHDGNDHSGSSEHNEYLGNEDIDGGYGFGADGGVGHTTTAFCTGCHGLFHDQQLDANAMWIRHPSDRTLPTSGEYQACASYDPLSPVARGSLQESSSASVTPGTDMVMCLSCHHPHGSPYPDMLRWDYAAQISGGGEGCATGRGCFFCHTTKDD